MKTIIIFFIFLFFNNLIISSEPEKILKVDNIFKITIIDKHSREPLVGVRIIDEYSLVKSYKML